MEEKSKKEELLSKAQRLCSEREYCESDIRNKLESWGETNENVTDGIIASLKEEKFIDEERYAGAFARDRFKYQQWGRVKITAQMKLKHIPSATIATGLATIDEKEYHEVLKEILLTHRKNVRAKNRYDLKGKLLRHALAKGFESHLVYEMVNEITGDADSE
jgi:regulatory protein